MSTKNDEATNNNNQNPCSDGNTKPFYESSSYKMVAMIISMYCKARIDDMLPDEHTEQALGMAGNSDSPGRTLYGAMTTLWNHGRISRTMLEQAYLFSPSSYPQYMQLWIASLPPNERSMYAANLYNSKFNGIKWDHQLQTNVHNMHVKDGYDLRNVKPPVPIGDDRHQPRMECITQFASKFYSLFNYGILLDGALGDWHAKLDPETDAKDILKEVGKCFGIQDADQLNWTDRSDNKNRSSTISRSELILRTWNVLYFLQRICKTELERALVDGPVAMLKLFVTAVGTALLNSSIERSRNSFSPNLDQASAMDLLSRAQNLMETTDSDIIVTFFESIPDSTMSAQTPNQECDYCGSQVSKDPPPRCSKCKIAIYCNQECQRGDWKRHKPLCSQNNNNNIKK